MVRPGIDVLLADACSLLKGKRCGLITNPSAVTADGVPTADALHAHDAVELVALFGPEHGIRSDHQEGDVPDGTDPRTGLPVYSLYGPNRQPTPEQLSGIDVLLFDIQDVGMRFYTYISTMSLSMEAAGAAGVEFIVLDRPNPIGGEVVEGSVTDPGFISFVGCQPVALRHGMTVGELAAMFAERFHQTPPELTIIDCDRWGRELWFDQTGLPWRKPSPGIYTMDTCIAYGCTCFLEGTRMSEGRGTETPFEVFGAPWMDGEAMAEALNGLDLPGVEFHGTEFTPEYSKHKGVHCGGVRIDVLNRGLYRCVSVAVAILTEAHRLWPNDFEWTPGFFIDRLAGTDRLRKGVDAGESAASILSSWQPDAERFALAREPYLRY